jgi:hypothetical protein
VQGKYEMLLEKALDQVGPRPWNKHDLDRVRQTLTEEFCLAFDPGCDKDAVLDWLNALPPEELAGLIDRLNAR